MRPPTVTAAVLTRNEERVIERCLASVAWADEVLVADCGSTDSTVSIARRMGARVVTWAWEGFLRQRLRAIEEASGEWVLFIDADEWVGPEFGPEVRARLPAPGGPEAYRVSRKNFYLDRFVDHAWGEDLILRLFRRGRVRMEGLEPHVHAVPLAGIRTGRLESPLMHEAFRSIDEMVAKAVVYARAYAAPDETDHLFHPIKLVTSPLASLFKCLVLKRGILDGPYGLVVAVTSAFYHFLKHARKWEKLRQAQTTGQSPPLGAPPRGEADPRRGLARGILPPPTTGEVDA